MREDGRHGLWRYAAHQLSSGQLCPLLRVFDLGPGWGTGLQWGGWENVLTVLTVGGKDYVLTCSDLTQEGEASEEELRETGNRAYGRDRSPRRAVLEG